MSVDMPDTKLRVSRELASFRIDCCEGWLLTADEAQWIIRSPRNRRKTIVWLPRAFVGSDKRVLKRTMNELGLGVGVVSNPSLHAFLGEEPVLFTDWVRSHAH